MEAKIMKKLNSRGMLHHILPLLFIVIFVIIGVGYLVYSHAATTSTPEIESEDGNNGASGWCINDEGGSTATNNPVFTAACSGSTAQQWSYSGSGQIINTALSGSRC